jgi:tetratricopeptide (TPR) repeat protein
MTLPRDRADRRGCADAETIAAFVDGRLPAGERAALEAHAADCADCRESIAEVTLALVRRREARPSRAASPWVLSTLATAAAIVFAAGAWYATRPEADEQGLAVLAHAVGAHRFAEARLSEGFAYAPAPSANRGAPEPSAPLDLVRAALDLQTLAAAHPTVGNLRASGISWLATGHLDAAIETLDQATRLSPNDAAAAVDLSAALLERWREMGTVEDARAALIQARRGLLSPRTAAAARFNVALALEALGTRPQAIDAWQRVLDQDDASPWTGEARGHLARLR